MRLRPPCSPDCEKRSGKCHSECEDWKQYEVERNKWYQERLSRIEAEKFRIVKLPYKGKGK